MLDDTFSFDSAGVTPATPNEPLPTRWYRMWISASQIKPTRDGRGKILELELTVISGPNEGRKAWTRINVVNASQQAQEIAQRELSAICHATGVLKFKHHEELRHKPMLVRLGIERQEGYDDKNKVTGYKESDDKAAPAKPRATRPAAARSAAPAPVQDEDDDLPF